MRQSKKVIITCAVTGSIHTPSMSEHLPITPDEIAAAAVGAAEAGAAMVHLHARRPDNGHPTQDPELFAQFLPRIKQQSDVIINITTGGGQGMSMEERLAPALRMKPEVVSMNMGSLNFNISGAGSKVEHFKYDWEAPYLAASEDMIMTNTFKQIKNSLTVLGEIGTRFEFECYDVSHLYNLAYFAEIGLAKPPFFIQCIFGVLGGLRPDPENLLHMRTIADKLFGDAYYLSVLAAGRHQMAFTTLSAILGGNVRVGLEDSLYLGKGEFAKSNAEQVTKIRGILEALSFEIATPAEARTILETKGGDNVGF